ncbi:MAG TPA: hypothetical protein VFP97_15490 [Chitinophagaceae bacterium]|nr:hypothetical protein [Chitinophagaceae bacterium]
MKAILLSCLSIFTISISTAQQSKGPKSGGGFSNEALAGANRSWTAVENVQASDDQYSDFSNLNNSSNSYTDYIHVNKFLLDVPFDAIITGIKVDVERSDPNQNTADYSIRILKYDIVTGDEKSTGEAYAASDTYRTFGGNGDLWGEVWTPDMINDNGFGIAIAAQRIDGNPGQTDGRIDDITITIFYDQPSTLPVSLLSFSAKKNYESIELMWVTEAESNISHYELQRSSDGRSFSSLQTIQSRNTLSKMNYSYRDNKPANGIAYYRLKIAEVDGSISYSKIVTVQFATGNSIAVYPTLWKKGTALKISNPNNENLTAHFFTATGQHVSSAKTTRSSLPTDGFNKLKGIIYFRIMNAEGQQLSKGSIVVD